MFILQKGIVMASKTDTPKKTSSTKIAAPKKASAKTSTTTKKVAVKATNDVADKPKRAKKAEPMSGFERYKMIEVAAYYSAEKNGFAGNAADYWIAAEKEIDKKGAKK
jgi:hypothetical protein